MNRVDGVKSSEGKPTGELGCAPVPSLYTHVLLCQLHLVVSFEELRDFLKVLTGKKVREGGRKTGRRELKQKIQFPGQEVVK